MMKPGSRIDEMFAFVCIDESDDIEGVAGYQNMPLVGADMERIESLKGVAQLVAVLTGRRVEVIKFNQREHVEWIEL